MTEREEKLIQLARDVIRLSRNTLLVNLRFLDMALSNLQPVETNLISFATDGQFLAYNPEFILKRYTEAREIPVRDYLHVVLHCVFRHMYIHKRVDVDCWDLACDIAVEHTISGLKLKAATTPRELDQEEEFETLEQEVKPLTAEKLYRYFLDHKPSDEERIRLKELFFTDDHKIWYMPPEEKNRYSLQFRVNAGTSGSQETEQEKKSDGNEESQNNDDVETIVGKNATQMEEVWAEIAQRMQQDLETFSQKQGTKAGNLIQSLSEVNREKYDYSSFLKKFAVIGEVMKINDDEFDYVYYTYGLKLYQNMPLIEPLEYKDVKRIREFVIAIDTSGSTSGKLVQSFLQKTYNILQESESFFHKINVHIIQCDSQIQDEKKITCRKEFDEYLKTMKLRGMGGTDFRPVFSYVNTLLRNGEFQNLKGLIYFTDGFGTFPNKKPEYETAFVFMQNFYNNYDVPPWAIKLILQKEDFKD